MNRGLEPLYPKLRWLRYVGAVALTVVILGAFAWVGSVESDLAEDDRKHYCMMVALWKDTNGRAGWPEFNGECK